MEWFIIFTLIAVAVVFIVKKAGQRPKQKETPVLTVTEQVGFGSASTSGSDILANSWRITFSSAVETYNGFYEIEMRATSGGVDQCVGGTPAISRQYIGLVSYCFDDNPSGLCLAWPPNQWISYTFPTQVTVKELYLTSTPTYGSGPDTIILQYYDGTSWVDVQTWTGITWLTNPYSQALTV